ncbi:hypothetical protein FGO68_gene2639 [Halteria grandinella]|uniref:Uncharacterized protein n=1 Tax=Halteria grandinella TaxID=5974 RepID=A0A8J8NN66_HALGN|nr:hypothetical protein FGO68_gene2639 [Halteria grandinella]
MMARICISSAAFIFANYSANAESSHTFPAAKWHNCGIFEGVEMQVEGESWPSSSSMITSSMGSNCLGGTLQGTVNKISLARYAQIILRIL